MCDGAYPHLALAKVNVQMISVFAAILLVVVVVCQIVILITLLLTFEFAVEMQATRSLRSYIEFR